MEKTNEGYSNSDITHLIGRVLLARDPKKWTITAALNVAFTLCLIPANSITNWTMPAIFGILLLIWLTSIAVWYAHTGGGFIDCCAAAVIPAFIASVTFISTTITFSPYPIWEWSFNYHDIRYAQQAVENAIIWGGGSGVVGFFIGKLSRAISWVRSNSINAAN